MSRPKVREDVGLMQGYHSPQLDVETRLNTNEAPEPPPEAFTERLAAATRSVDWNRYPDRSAARLRAAIADAESPAAGWSIHADNIFVANGSNEVLQTVCLAFGGEGRKVATFEPTYALHSHIAKVVGTAVLSAPRGPDFGLDMGTVEELVSSEKPIITFLCSPNNPTGGVDSPEEIATVLGIVESVGGLLVVDEAYGQFAVNSAMELVSEERSLVVTRTFSKTWSAAALRLGYLVGPRWLVADLDKVVLPYHLDAMKQLAGEVAIEFEDEMKKRVAFIVEERGRLVSEMGDLELTQWPTGSNFILFRPGTPKSAGPSGDEVWQRLVDDGVLIRNCASWPGLEDCLRVTIGTRQENDQFLAALAKAL